MKILIIEDEDQLAGLIRKSFARVDMQSDVTGTLADAETALMTRSYDAVILDLALPDGAGQDILARNRRARGSVPILVLTAQDAVDSRITCLNLGADDYVIKPFDMDELIARVRALLRRSSGPLGLTIAIGNVTFDTVGRSATVDGSVLNLTRRELGILEHLLRRAGRVVPKDVLEERLYESAETLESNPVPVHVHTLRKKLADKSADVEIHTVRGVGYILSSAT